MNSEQYIVEIYDPETGCIEHQLPFPSDLAAKLDSAYGLKDLRTGEQCELRVEDVSRLHSLFKVDLRPGAKAVVRRRHRIDGLPYQVHTGRELLLMIRGEKPLAAFSDLVGDDATDGLIPEEYFNPFVAKGEILKDEFIVYNDSFSMKYVLYALPSEAWRLRAYRLLKETASHCKWSEGLERMEGALLGYEDWQNDAYMEFMGLPR